ncbi:hypothetical protein SESBI_11520 [Sesbania bispinosa]|nr:hypothetical protein SESBI_11520 [Sesbania bispinosa]
MSSLKSSQKEDDSLERSTKKVKMEPPKATIDEADSSFTACENPPKGESKEDQPVPIQKQKIASNPKPSYKDMVIASEISEEDPPWKTTLIVKLLGKKIGFRFMSKRIQQLWANKDPDDYKHALYEGPWLIADHYLLVQRWRPLFNPYQDTVRKIGVWARNPQLPIELYNKHFLWRVAAPKVHEDPSPIDPNKDSAMKIDPQALEESSPFENKSIEPPLDPNSLVTQPSSDEPSPQPCFAPWMLVKRP